MLTCNSQPNCWGASTMAASCVLSLVLFMHLCFSDRSWTSCGRGSKLWKRDLHKLSSLLSLPHRQRTKRTLRLEQVWQKEKRGTLEVQKRGRGEEMKNWVQMQRRKDERTQRRSSRQAGGSTEIGCVTHSNYVNEVIDV